jgi:hypothetical protein
MSNLTLYAKSPKKNSIKDRGTIVSKKYDFRGELSKIFAQPFHHAHRTCKPLCAIELICICDEQFSDVILSKQLKGAKEANTIC